MQQPALRKSRTRQRHNQSNWLRDVILGGQDGLVNILGIVLGVSAASSDVHIMIVAALAATLAESISMGAVGYTSSLAERDHYLAEMEREQREIHEAPDVERRAVREIYAAKGFDGELLDRVVEQITSDPDVWAQVMMEEELRLAPVDTTHVRRTSVIITFATLAGSVIPLLPFLVLPRGPAIIAAVVVSGLVLFAVGAYKAISLVGDWRRSGLQMLAIGLGAAFIGFLVGRLIGATP